MAKAKRYKVSHGKLELILEVAEEGGYIVTSPSHPEVLTQAETIEEAFENARDVIALFKADQTGTKKRPAQRLVRLPKFRPLAFSKQKPAIITRKKQRPGPQQTTSV